MFNAARSLANRRARSHSGLSHGYIVGGLGFTLENQRVGFAPRMNVPDLEADAPNSSPATKRTQPLARIVVFRTDPEFASWHRRPVETVNARPIPPLPRRILAPAAGFSVPEVKGTCHHRDKLDRLLKTFINAANHSDKILIAQTTIDITFLLSAMAIAASDRIMFPADGMKPKDHRPNEH